MFFLKIPQARRGVAGKKRTRVREGGEMKYFFPSLLIGVGIWLIWLVLLGASQHSIPIVEVIRLGLIVAGVGTFGVGVWLAKVMLAKDGKRK